jgi:hypothetical protein
MKMRILKEIEREKKRLADEELKLKEEKQKKEKA